MQVHGRAGTAWALAADSLFVSANYTIEGASRSTEKTHPGRKRICWREHLCLLEPAVQKRIATGAGWSIIGAGFASGFAMLSNIVCARMLSSVRFGELGIVLATTNLFTSVFTSGLSMTATRYVAEYRDSDPDRAGVIVGLSSATSCVVGAIMAMVICLFAPLLSSDVLKAPGLSVPLMLGAAAMFFAAVNGSQIGSLTGFESFNRIAVGNLIRGVATLVFVTAGAALGGLKGALAGYVAVGAVTAIFYQIVIRRECTQRSVTISYRFGREDFAILWRYTFPILVSTFSFTPAAWWSNVLLATRSGYAEAGVFSAILNWQTFILFLSNAISRIGLPMLSNVRAERDPAKYKLFLNINFLLVSAPAIAVAGPVAICAPLILRLYGPGFTHGTNALVLISIAAVLSAVNIPVGNAIWSLDATVSAMVLALLNGGVLVLSAYLLSARGAAGLAGAYVIMGVIQTAANVPFMIWLVRRRFVQRVSTEEIAVA